MAQISDIKRLLIYQKNKIFIKYIILTQKNIGYRKNNEINRYDINICYIELRLK